MTSSSTTTAKELMQLYAESQTLHSEALQTIKKLMLEKAELQEQVEALTNTVSTMATTITQLKDLVKSHKGEA
ncbi:hypothetical protein [Vibrio harveyi]|uniref:hypothetical protein n=1 Tax=Vibrio harveyi TaxID=669 RepID=UPI003908C62E